MTEHIPTKPRVKIGDERLPIIGERLRNIRKSKQLTQSELAKSMGSTTAVISDLELGKGNPTITTFLVLCNALEIEPNELLHGLRRTSNNSDSKGH